MGIVNSPGLPTLADHLRFVGRHARIVTSLMALGLLVGLGWAIQEPATYSATASVELTPVPKYITPVTDELAAPEVTIDTDAQLLASPQVLNAVGARLDTDNETAATHLLVSASPNTYVLHVTVESSSPVTAAAAADAAAAALIEVRRESLGALQEDQILQLGRLVTQQEQVLAREQSREVLIPESAESFAHLVELRAALEELQWARQEPGRLVRASTAPRAPDYANSEVPIVSGAMLGLLAGCLIGAGRDRFRGHSHESITKHHRPRLSGQLRPVTITAHEEPHHDY